MAKCFVIQPFDKGGPYDKRYRDVLTPAIADVGLEPYRVDEDPKTVILIDDIENGIRDAEICLADITTDNPNIWYEVGFALASGKPVVLICADPRPNLHFPFDIRHRKIITYALHSSSDFEKLRTDITVRLKAQAQKAETMQTVAAISEMETTQGLSAHEIAVLVTIMSERVDPTIGLSTFVIQEKMKRAGFTPIAAGLAMESLIRKGMAEYFNGHDNNDYDFIGCQLTMKGTDWLLVNQDRFKMRKDEVASISEEDIPF